MARLNHLYTSQKKVRGKKISTKSPHNNFTLVGYAISILAGLILFQIFRWQVIDSESLKLLASEQYQSSGTQTASRGKITAADGTILAVDQPVWDIFATLSTDETERAKFFNEKDKFVTEVASILGVEKSTIEEKITDDFVYVSLAKNISTDIKNALAQDEIFGTGTAGFGLYFENKEQRVYPNGSLAAHLLGFIGKNAEGEPLGQYGLQGYYFRDLNGSEGYTYEEKDSAGNVILTSEYDPILPREGKDFTLTIIPNLQTKVEEQLAKGVKDTRSKSGSVIIMDPETGAILAMANYPTYLPAEYWRISEPWILKNRAVSDVYEYGSVQKPITLAIALDAGTIKEDYTCNDKTGSLDLYKETGYLDLKGRFIYTWNKRPNGVLNIAGIFAKSNNPCAAKAGLTVPLPTFYSYLQAFGIGQFLGVGLQDESTSYMKPLEQWTLLDQITASYGQGISATELQVVSALSAIANHGTRMRPYVISQISDEKETIDIKPQVLSQPVSKEVADIISKDMAEGVQQDAFGGLAKELKNYKIAGKTGTAQVAKSDGVGYLDDLSNATAIGFAPYDDPKFIMIVKLEEPQVSTYASYTSVPVWQDIFLAIKDDLEIQKGN
ncbi:MAG: Peptidoglycan glycosyltransferase [candidate division WS6 bacterium GW2011_GWF1_36_8]|uniref:Peptidoglycan glycosyltransferase n=1 Tax=candidate division WS6 bacterium GW2011_GWF1_36_8 TaxID=1619098 RepID=A0A0G0FN98_9BACT|nr:MAG: Peptidoglycan glycosyltransferase [candidate division WS6 bacterium GW2011_GWF1_36_8]